MLRSLGIDGRFEDIASIAAGSNDDPSWWHTWEASWFEEDEWDEVPAWMEWDQGSDGRPGALDVDAVIDEATEE
jgi:hypothetical protein